MAKIFILTILANLVIVTNAWYSGINPANVDIFRFKEDDKCLIQTGQNSYFGEEGKKVDNSNDGSRYFGTNIGKDIEDAKSEIIQKIDSFDWNRFFAKYFSILQQQCKADMVPGNKSVPKIETHEQTYSDYVRGEYSTNVSYRVFYPEVARGELSGDKLHVIIPGTGFILNRNNVFDIEAEYTEFRSNSNNLTKLKEYLANNPNLDYYKSNPTFDTLYKNVYAGTVPEYDQTTYTMYKKMKIRYFDDVNSITDFGEKVGHVITQTFPNFFLFKIDKLSKNVLTQNEFKQNSKFPNFMTKTFCSEEIIPGNYRSIYNKFSISCETETCFLEFLETNSCKVDFKDNRLTGILRIMRKIRNILALFFENASSGTGNIFDFNFGSDSQSPTLTSKFALFLDLLIDFASLGDFAVQKSNYMTREMYRKYLNDKNSNITILKTQMEKYEFTQRMYEKNPDIFKGCLNKEHFDNPFMYLTFYDLNKKSDADFAKLLCPIGMIEFLTNEVVTKLTAQKTLNRTLFNQMKIDSKFILEFFRFVRERGLAGFISATESIFSNSSGSYASFKDFVLDRVFDKTKLEKSQIEFDKIILGTVVRIYDVDVEFESHRIPNNFEGYPNVHLEKEFDRMIFRNVKSFGYQKSISMANLDTADVCPKVYLYSNIDKMDVWKDLRDFFIEMSLSMKSTKELECNSIIALTEYKFVEFYWYYLKFIKDNWVSLEQKYIPSPWHVDKLNPLWKQFNLKTFGYSSGDKFVPWDVFVTYDCKIIPNVNAVRPRRSIPSELGPTEGHDETSLLCVINSADHVDTSGHRCKREAQLQYENKLHSNANARRNKRSPVLPRDPLDAENIASTKTQNVKKDLRKLLGDGAEAFQIKTHNMGEHGLVQSRNAPAGLPIAGVTSGVMQSGDRLLSDLSRQVSQSMSSLPRIDPANSMSRAMVSTGSLPDLSKVSQIPQFGGAVSSALTSTMSTAKAAIQGSPLPPVPTGTSGGIPLGSQLGTGSIPFVTDVKNFADIKYGSQTSMFQQATAAVQNSKPGFVQKFKNWWNRNEIAAKEARIAADTAAGIPQYSAPKSIFDTQRIDLPDGKGVTVNSREEARTVANNLKTWNERPDLRSTIESKGFKQPLSMEDLTSVGKSDLVRKSYGEGDYAQVRKGNKLYQSVGSLSEVMKDQDIGAQRRAASMPDVRSIPSIGGSKMGDGDYESIDRKRVQSRELPGVPKAPPVLDPPKFDASGNPLPDRNLGNPSSGVGVRQNPLGMTSVGETGVPMKENSLYQSADEIRDAAKKIQNAADPKTATGTGLPPAGAAGGAAPICKRAAGGADCHLGTFKGAGQQGSTLKRDIEPKYGEFGDPKASAQASKLGAKNVNDLYSTVDAKNIKKTEAVSSALKGMEDRIYDNRAPQSAPPSSPPPLPGNHPSQNPSGSQGSGSGIYSSLGGQHIGKPVPKPENIYAEIGAGRPQLPATPASKPSNFAAAKQKMGNLFSSAKSKIKSGFSRMKAGFSKAGRAFAGLKSKVNMFSKSSMGAMPGADGGAGASMGAYFVAMQMSQLQQNSMRRYITNEMAHLPKAEAVALLLLEGASSLGMAGAMAGGKAAVVGMTISAIAGIATMGMQIYKIVNPGAPLDDPDYQRITKYKYMINSKEAGLRGCILPNSELKITLPYNKYGDVINQGTSKTDDAKRARGNIVVDDSVVSKVIAMYNTDLVYETKLTIKCPNNGQLRLEQASLDKHISEDASPTDQIRTYKVVGITSLLSEFPKLEFSCSGNKPTLIVLRKNYGSGDLKMLRRAGPGEPIWSKNMTSDVCDRFPFKKFFVTTSGCSYDNSASSVSYSSCSILFRKSTWDKVKQRWFLYDPFAPFGSNRKIFEFKIKDFRDIYPVSPNSNSDDKLLCQGYSDEYCKWPEPFVLDDTSSCNQKTRIFRLNIASIQESNLKVMHGFVMTCPLQATPVMMTVGSTKETDITIVNLDKGFNVKVFIPNRVGAKFWVWCQHKYIPKLKSDVVEIYSEKPAGFVKAKVNGADTKLIGKYLYYTGLSLLPAASQFGVEQDTDYTRGVTGISYAPNSGVYDDHFKVFNDYLSPMVITNNAEDKFNSTKISKLTQYFPNFDKMEFDAAELFRSSARENEVGLWDKLRDGRKTYSGFHAVVAACDQTEDGFDFDVLGGFQWNWWDNPKSKDPDVRVTLTDSTYVFKAYEGNRITKLGSYEYRREFKNNEKLKHSSSTSRFMKNYLKDCRFVLKAEDKKFELTCPDYVVPKSAFNKLKKVCISIGTSRDVCTSYNNDVRKRANGKEDTYTFADVDRGYGYLKRNEWHFELGFQWMKFPSQWCYCGSLYYDQMVRPRNFNHKSGFMWIKDILDESISSDPPPYNTNLMFNKNDEIVPWDYFKSIETMEKKYAELVDIKQHVHFRAINELPDIIDDRAKPMVRINIDSKYLQTLKEEQETKLKQLQSDIYKESINILSHSIKEAKWYKNQLSKNLMECCRLTATPISQTNGKLNYDIFVSQLNPEVLCDAPESFFFEKNPNTSLILSELNKFEPIDLVFQRNYGVWSVCLELDTVDFESVEDYNEWLYDTAEEMLRMQLKEYLEEFGDNVTTIVNDLTGNETLENITKIISDYVTAELEFINELNGPNTGEIVVTTIFVALVVIFVLIMIIPFKPCIMIRYKIYYICLNIRKLFLHVVARFIGLVAPSYSIMLEIWNKKSILEAIEKMDEKYKSELRECRSFRKLCRSFNIKARRKMRRNETEVDSVSVKEYSAVYKPTTTTDAEDDVQIEMQRMLTDGV
ncbi:surface glycoprotein [Carp edema virus]|nr:surface glycoprotein [Carp edema virus]